MTAWPKVRLRLRDSPPPTAAAPRLANGIAAESGAVRYLHRAALTRLRPGTPYIYASTNDGAAPVSGSFRTAAVVRNVGSG